MNDEARTERSGDFGEGTDTVGDTAFRDAYLRLAMVPDIGPITLTRLLEFFGGDPRRVLAADESELHRVEGVGPRRATSIRRADRVPLEEMLDLCQRHAISILTPADPVYPIALRHIPDPPAVLFMRGELRPEDALSIAMVGTRHPSQYGSQIATRLAEGLASAGLTIVSGLARGIDACSHEGAIAAGGRTLAVLGSGLLEIYPPEHARLAERIVASGAILSEMPPLAKPLSEAFPRRNRIVSGLSLGVIVVEAGDRSGTMITARHAAEQGREVLAVPGRLTDRTAHGTLRLIRDGAAMVLGVESVLDHLGPLIEPITKKFPTTRPGDPREFDLDDKPTLPPKQTPLSAAPAPDAGGTSERSSADKEPESENLTIRHPAELRLNDIERRVLAAIGDGDAMAVDAVIAASGLVPQQVLTALTVLEMRHLIHRRGLLVARS